MVLWNEENSGGKYYKVIANIGNNCAKCLDLSGSAFLVSDAKIGENFPPFHPNCNCETEPVSDILSDKNATKNDDEISHSPNLFDTGNMILFSPKLLNITEYISKPTGNEMPLEPPTSNIFERIRERMYRKDGKTETSEDVAVEPAPPAEPVGPFTEEQRKSMNLFPWGKPKSEPVGPPTFEQMLQMANPPWMGLPKLESSTKDGVDVGETYVQNQKSEISSGKIYTTDDLYRLNGKTLKVQNDAQPAHEVTIRLEPELLNSIMIISNEFQTDPTLILAVMAHESGFVANTTSELGAMGLMQTMPEWFYQHAEPYKDLIISMGGNYDDPYDPITNIVSWNSQFKMWVREYGETEEALRALRQGFKGAGWSSGAINNGKEFLDLKQQLDDYIFN